MVKQISQKILLIGLILVFALSIFTAGVNAQSYSFQLTDELVHYYVNEDGTVSVEYYFTFKNDSGASAIDFVDVGMPNSNFDLNNITADVNGNPVGVSSDYQGDGGSGFAVELGQYAITDVGVVHVRADGITGMIYEDTEKSDYASSEFGTTYFSSDFVYGPTNLTVVFHFPVAVLPEESIYHIPSSSWNGPQEPAMVDTQTGITYTWFDPSANGSTQYQFGISFPKRVVPADAITTFTWFDAVIGFIVGVLPCVLPAGFFLLFFVILPVRAITQARKRKLEYIKPTISTEGQGIKRGLTAVEAAILLGVPLDKVLTMILFGVSKKGAMEVLREKPLQVKKAEVLPADLNEYEKQFVESMVADMGKRKIALQKMFVDLVKSVTEKMKGFSKKETVAYYQSIIEKAWTQVAEAKTPDITPILNEESLEWTMADRDFEDRSRRTFTGPVLLPQWYGHYSPSTSSGQSSIPTSSGIPSSSGSGRVQLPGADFAASMVSGVENFSGQLVGNINEFTGNITNVTNPVPVATSSGRRSGGGGSCACACACAGCACACAGGGR